MNTIKWWGAALLTAAGIAIVVATASAQSIAVDRQQTAVALAGAAQTAAGQLVRSCWAGQLSEVRHVHIRRGKDADAGRLFMDVSGKRALTSAESWALLHDQGKGVEGGRLAREDITCELTAAAQLTALTTVNAAAWSGNLQAMTHLEILRSPVVPGLTLRATGVVALTQAQADTALLAGEDLVPVGVPQ